jgi:MFS family permease
MGYDKKRWIVLAVFSCFSASNAIQYASFGPVVDQAKSEFSMRAIEVNALSLSYGSSYALLGFLGCGTLERLGLTKNLFIGNVLNVIGALLKFVAPLAVPHFWILMIAQIFNAFAQLFMLSVPPLLASQWFPTTERTVATAIASMANNVGTALGMILPPLIVLNSSTPREGFIWMFLMQLIICVVLAILTFLLPAHPSVPPSEEAEVVAAEESALIGTPEEHKSEWQKLLAILRAAKTLLVTNSTFRWLLLGSSVPIAAGWALSTVLAQLMLPFGVSETIAGWAGFASLIAGTICAFFFGMYIDRKRRYKGPILLLLAAASVTLAVMLIGMYFGNQNAAIASAVIFYTLCGTFSNAIIPVFLEYAMECTFPAPESISSTAIMVFSNALAFVSILVASAVLGNTPGRSEATAAICIFIGAFAFGGVACIFMPDDRRRFNHEQAAKFVSESTVRTGQYTVTEASQQSIPF